MGALFFGKMANERQIRFFTSVHSLGTVAMDHIRETTNRSFDGNGFSDGKIKESGILAQLLYEKRDLTLMSVARRIIHDTDQGLTVFQPTEEDYFAHQVTTAVSEVEDANGAELPNDIRKLSQMIIESVMARKIIDRNLFRKFLFFSGLYQELNKRHSQN